MLISNNVQVRKIYPYPIHKMKAYKTAIEEKYNFLAYGDAMLILYSQYFGHNKKEKEIFIAPFFVSNGK